jgi:hypothetical protein
MALPQLRWQRPILRLVGSCAQVSDARVFCSLGMQVEQVVLVVLFPLWLVVALLGGMPIPPACPNCMVAEENRTPERQNASSSATASTTSKIFPFPPVPLNSTATMNFDSLKDKVANLTLYDIKAGVRQVQNGALNSPCVGGTAGQQLTCNAAVMNYTEMEAKVREATNNEPYVAIHVTDMAVEYGVDRAAAGAHRRL